MRIKPLKKDAFLLRSDQALAKIIQLIPGQIVTKEITKKILLKEGVAYPDIKEDILKIAVVERHKATGNVGVGFVQGFGLRKEPSVHPWLMTRITSSLWGPMIRIC